MGQGTLSIFHLPLSGRVQQEFQYGRGTRYRLVDKVFAVTQDVAIQWDASRGRILMFLK